jgi:hypothetical protein
VASIDGRARLSQIEASHSSGMSLSCLAVSHSGSQRPPSQTFQSSPSNQLSHSNRSASPPCNHSAVIPCSLDLGRVSLCALSLVGAAEQMQLCRAAGHRERDASGRTFVSVRLSLLGAGSTGSKKTDGGLQSINCCLFVAGSILCCESWSSSHPMGFSH